jgi:HK97 family phage major capsid protein/HK97 family phage prohead protease
MLTRAHSVLTIKSVSEDQRIIEGTASTPVTDRVGDILEPLGAEFTLPIPLLWQHRSAEPIGQVIWAKATKAGIEIRAKIAKDLLPRIDEAWALIKSGLVRGLSVGFNPIEYAQINDGSYGLRFLKWEWLELSAVTVPANSDATIEVIRSLDTERPAAPGAAARVPATRSGVPDSRVRAGAKPMNISERLTAAKAALKTKSARLEELMTKAAGETLSREELDEKGTVKDEVDTLTSEIGDLETLEKAQAIQARPVAVVAKGAVQAPAQTPNQHITVEKKLPPAIEFTHYVKCLMLARGNPFHAMEVAKTRYADEPRIQMLLKDAVTGHSTDTGSPTSGAELVYATNLVSEFIEFLMPQTVVGRFGAGNIPSLRRVPFNVRITGRTSGGAGYWVGEAKPKPLKKYTFTAQSLTWAKVAAITVQSEELARFSNPSSDTLLRDALTESLRERLDIDFIDPDVAAVANVNPGGITNGIAALVSSGTDAAGVRADIQQLVQAFLTANNPLTSGVIITSNEVALVLSLMRNALGNREFPDLTMNGGTLEGFPVLTSQYAASLGSPSGNLLILVNASDIFLSDDGGVSIDASREASLEMSDSPETDSGTELVSMYQTNQIALRAERFINWARRRETAVAWIQDINYVSGSPA